MSEFKVGDKVRMTRTVCIGYDTFPQGTEGYVVRNDSKGLWVEMPNSEDGKLTSWWCLDSNIELVAPTDPTREFLERLQSLLREFDADIQYFDGLAIRIGNCYETWSSDTITADNIMDFDKE